MKRCLVLALLTAGCGSTPTTSDSGSPPDTDGGHSALDGGHAGLDGGQPIDAPACPDEDGDGHGAMPCGDDCDDTVATTNPDAVETCNNVDDDCNTMVDDGAANASCADPAMHLAGVCMAGGTCATRCATGFLDCDTTPDCETTESVTQCGACMHACLHPTCTDGVCTDDFVQIAPGNGHTCGRRGSGVVECWGLNDTGQLGDGTTTDHTTPAPVTGLTDAVDIASGSRSTCAVRATGAVVCWGRNNQGQFGTGDYTNSNVPVTAMGVSDATGVAVGGAETCITTRSGQAMCAGYGGDGELGNGSTSGSNMFVAVTGVDDAAQVAVGEQHACARRTGGAVACWGLNDHGQLGDGTTTMRTTPVTVTGLMARSIGAGEAHVCARDSTNAVQCWGLNDHGQLGDGSTTERHSPVMATTGVPNAVGLAVQAYSTCVRGNAGIVACWGAGGSGEIGDANNNDRHMGVRVSMLTDAAHLGAGFDYACAIRETGAVVCWGDNGFGELGDGTTTSHNAPVAIVDP